MGLRSTGVCLVLLVSVAAAFAAGGALTVNGVEVSAAEVGLARQVVRIQAPYEAREDAKATAMAVDKVVADILLAAEATRAGEKVSKKQVREGIAAFRSWVGGDAPYEELLASALSEPPLGRLTKISRTLTWAGW